MVRLSLLSLVTPLLAVIPAVTASPEPEIAAVQLEARGNVTERTFGWNWNPNGWSPHKCANVQGDWNGFKFNFGCLCQADVDDFCANNNINRWIETLLYQYIQDFGATNWYPKNSQPTCDGRGGYDCGGLRKKSDGSCGQTSCDPTQCSSNGGCCPRGQTYQNGVCCGQTGCWRQGKTCGPVLQCPNGLQKSNGVCCQNNWTGYENSYCCPPGQYGSNGKCVCPSGTIKDGNNCKNQCNNGHKWCNTRCCPSYLTENNQGQCVCSDAAYQDNGSACVPKCDSNSNYNYQTGKCQPNCDTAAGYYPKTNPHGQTLCCKKGWTPCQTICCAPGTEEVGNTGVCCIPGSTVVNGKCQAPSGLRKKRALAGKFDINEQTTLGKSASTYGLAGNKDGKLCPNSLAACPIPGRETDYECIDSSSDLQSCGGCITLGDGVDCTKIRGARWMGCTSGKCEVYSCKKGFKRSEDGSSCIQDLPAK